MARVFVAYVRVSTEQQGHSGLGLEAQRAAIAAYVRSVGAVVAAEFSDVESGGKSKRPGLAAALAECKAQRATLLIAKLDRLARNVAFISNLMEGGVDFVAADMPSVNRLTVHVLAAVAEHEREMISQRTKAALAVAKIKGQRLGNPNLPPAGTLPCLATLSTPAGAARRAKAQASARAVYGQAVEAARSGGAVSLGDYAQAFQAVGVRSPTGQVRWSGRTVARLLCYMGARLDDAPAPQGDRENGHA